MIHHLDIKFISDSGARRQQTPPSSRVRFPEQDEDDLLLDVLPFPEERLALQQQRPVKLQTRHMILENHIYFITDNSKQLSPNRSASTDLVKVTVLRGELQSSQRRPQEAEAPFTAEE